MKKILVLTVLFLLSSFAVGDENLFTPDSVKDWRYTIGYNVFTTHPSSDGFTDSKTDERREWNESNKFVMLRVNVNDNVGFGVGKGINSYYEDSYLFGMELSTDSNRNGKFEFGSDIGLATGYDELIDGTGGVLPFLNPFIRYNEKVTNHLTISGKLGTINFMAINAFVELNFSF